MQTKLAGRLPLQDMISNVIADARQKLAAAEEGKDEEKKEKKHLAFEKKDEKKEEEDEHKKESSVNFHDAEEVEKLASALDYVSDLLKEADAIELGSESHQGGMVLPTAVPPKGVQPYKHDASKKHNVPMSTPLKSDPSQGSAATQMENNIHHAPGGGGTQKVSSASDIDAALAKMANMDKEALSPETLGSYATKSGRRDVAEAGVKGSGFGQFAPSNIKKAIEAATSPASVERGNKIVSALARSKKATGRSSGDVLGGFLTGSGKASSEMGHPIVGKMNELSGKAISALSKLKKHSSADDVDDALMKVAVTSGWAQQHLQNAMDKGIRGKAGLTGAQRVSKLMDRATKNISPSFSPNMYGKEFVNRVGAGAADRMQMARIGVTSKTHEMLNDHGADIAKGLLGKTSSADVDYILNKMAESTQGGVTLDSKSGEGVSPPSDSAGGNDLRKYLENNQSPVSMKKVDAKKIAKRSLADILSEPVQSKSTDSKVHENLSNASKGGVKIAQAKALLQKIASEGCTCASNGECKYCKMKTAMASRKSGSAAGN